MKTFEQITSSEKDSLITAIAAVGTLVITVVLNRVIKADDKRIL